MPSGTRQYSFRVQGKNTATNNVSGWANAAIFLSEAVNDGYVVKTGTSNYSAVPNANPPGIRAGEGTGTGMPHWRGILSFNTGALSSVTTSVVGARLRLHQSTAGNNFSSTNLCMVDVKNGSFGGNAALVGTDYTATATINAAFNIFNVPATVNGGWFEMTFPQSPASSYVGIGAPGSNDHTQFRLYFNEGTSPNKYEGWDSGESTTSPPQLVVQYQ